MVGLARHQAALKFGPMGPPSRELQECALFRPTQIRSIGERLAWFSQSNTSAIVEWRFSDVFLAHGEFGCWRGDEPFWRPTIGHRLTTIFFL